MASGVDESAYLGSSLDNSIVASTPDATKEKLKATKEKKNTRRSSLRASAKELIRLIDNVVAKEDTLSSLRAKANISIREGKPIRESLSDELLYSAGRIDAYNELRSLLVNAAKDGR